MKDTLDLSKPPRSWLARFRTSYRLYRCIGMSRREALSYAWEINPWH